MGAPIVVNTVKVQGTVSTSGTNTVGNAAANALFVQGTTTATIPNTAPAYIAGTVTSNVGSGTFPVSAAAANALFVQGTVDISEFPASSAVADAYTNTTTTSIAGLTMGFNGTNWDRLRSSSGALYVLNSSATAAFIQGTITSNVGSGTRSVSNVNTSALFVQGTTTITNAAAGAAFIQGTATITNTAANAAFVQGSVTVNKGATLGHGNVTITTAAGTVLTASATRRSAILTNTGTDYVWIGSTTSVTANQGARIAPGQTLILSEAAEDLIIAIASSGSQNLAYLTESD